MGARKTKGSSRIIKRRDKSWDKYKQEQQSQHKPNIYTTPKITQQWTACTLLKHEWTQLLVIG